MKNTLTLSYVLFVSFLFGVASLAQAQNDAVTSSLEVYTISTNDNGREVSREAKTTSPGDTLEYRLTYTNNRSNGISTLQPVLPIPAGLQYIGGTADPALTSASLDSTGNTFQSLPIQNQVTLSNGETETREVPARRYRRLQWTVDTLGSQQSVTLVARVWVININSSPQQ